MKTLVYLSHYPSFLLFYLLIRQISFFVDVCLCDGEGSGTPLHYSCLENPMDRGAWWAIVHGSQRVRHDLATEHAHMHAVW